MLCGGLAGFLAAYYTGSLTADNYDITYITGTLHIQGGQVFLPAVLH